MNAIEIMNKFSAQGECIACLEIKHRGYDSAYFYFDGLNNYKDKGRIFYV